MDSMLDVFNSDVFSMTTMAAALQKLPYQPYRLGPKGLNLFDERPIATLSIAVEEISGQLSLIAASGRGSAGDVIGDAKRTVRSFTAQHLRRNAKVMADEVQGVRMFGTNNTVRTIEEKRNEKLAVLQNMHEMTWEFHRNGAVLGKVLDADGTTVLLDIYSAFGISQTVQDFQLSSSTVDVRHLTDLVADAIDDALGGSTYDRVHVLCGSTWYDALVQNAYVQKVLQAMAAAGDTRLFKDLREGFTIGSCTFERAKRWKVKTPAGTTINMIDPDQAYAFPVGAVVSEGSIFKGFFAPQPFLDTVNGLNPPLVVKATMDPDQQFIKLTGISCPLYLNTRPAAVIKLTHS